MKAYPVTHLLLASLFAVFGLELAAGALGNDARLLQLGALRDAGPLNTDYWRALSYAWLHAGWNHLLLNAALLWWTGRIVERRVGSLRMLAVYLAAALAGGIGIAVRAALQPKPGVSLGASAACYALLAAAIVLLYRPDAARFGQPAGARIGLLAIAAAGIVVSFLPGVSLVGHAIGIVIGVAAGFLLPLV